MRILGIDPGSRLTGYGCVDLIGRSIRVVEHGTFRLSKTSGKTEIPLEARLKSVFEELNEVIQRLRPQVLVVERTFFAKNAASALKLGQTRGVILLCGALSDLEIAEYSPTEVKAAVAGHGTADKDQLARMIQMLFGTQKFATADASDALALAICHAYRGRVSNSGKVDATRTRSIAALQPKSKKKLSLAESVGIKLEHPRRTALK